ncbi:hypothetical protein PC119_g15185 [Phytophthora cactorum]|nr:hypothetical protein PC119_g15185 [Phytophthora cactorum]
MQEIVRAMNYVIEQGWAFYWGTSEWTGAEIIEACEVADRLGLIRPICDQTRYNILDRSRVDYDFVNLYKKYKYGITAFSALSSGVLTGKYNDGIPDGSRMSIPWFKSILSNGLEEKSAKAIQLAEIAKEIGCTLPQLAIACVETREFEMLILDEADTLLDMGFEVSLNKILEHLPKQRRTGLFSATQTQEVKALARAGLRNPATISVQVANNTQVTPATLQNYYCLVGHDQRLSALHHFVQSKKGEKLIVFFSTCGSVDFFSRVLEELFKGKKDFPVVALHGKMPQKKRTTNYDHFSALKSGLLYDPPQDPNFFVHRVGRTARAGRSGCALSFLSSNEDAYVNFLKIRKVPCEEMTLPLDTMEDVLPKVKSFILEDRDLLEKGTKAFMAFVRSYKEHQCQFIFRFKELDLGAAARGFCLLQLPKINELRNVRIDFEKTGIKTTDIKFKDKAREKERQKKLVAIAKENEARDKKNAEMREKKRKRPLEEENQKHPRRREKKKGLHQQIVEEWDELAEEEKLYKKMKKGKITEEEYEKALLGKADSSDDDEDEDEDGDKKKKPKWQRSEEKLKERFKKKEQVATKTAEQKREAAKREERIRKRKKSQHVQRAVQRAQRRGRR